MSGQSHHPLESWTRQTFGEDFAGLVLHGLLSDAESRTGRITVEGADRNGRKRRKTIAFVKPRPEAWGHKPPVPAGLLKQLVGRSEVESTRGFTFKALLDDLIWPDVPAMWRVVRDALKLPAVSVLAGRRGRGQFKAARDAGPPYAAHPARHHQEQSAPTRSVQ